MGLSPFVCLRPLPPVGLSFGVRTAFGDQQCPMGTSTLGMCIAPVAFRDCGAPVGKVSPSPGNHGEDESGREEGQGRPWELCPELS